MIHSFSGTNQPDLLVLHERWPERYPFLLESLSTGGRIGAHDLLLGWPSGVLQQRGGRLEASSGRLDAGDEFFTVLDRWTAKLRRPPEGNLPYCGGWFLFLGYELAAIAEPTLVLTPSPHRLPDALAVRCPAAVIRDHSNNVTTLVAESSQLMEKLYTDATKATRLFFDASGYKMSAGRESPPRLFLQGMKRALAYLQAGDIFQVNLSRSWHGELQHANDSQWLYRRLRRYNPAPFSASIRWCGSALLSSSPERLLLIDGGMAETRPIAGTHARGAGAASDLEQGRRLLANLKERAEHLMLIDLERNDLGRICRTASIEVNELMVLESYAHVHHIVSNVRGRLRDGVGPGTALKAVFPGGTITGCPKVRAMQVIAELEESARGPYTGSLGYLSRCGRLDTNIIIRSILCEDASYVLRAGAGIVADSDPQTELEETRAKARGMLLALGAADGG